MENGNRLQLRDRCQRLPKVGFVALGVGGGDGHINIQTCLFGGPQRGQSLRGRRGLRLIHPGQVVAHRRQAHAEHQPPAKAVEQIEISPRQRAPCENANVQCGMIADQFERAAHERACVRRQFALTHRVRVPDNLVRVRRAAIDHGAVAVGFELRARGMLRRPERGEELVLVPRSEQDVIAPLDIRVFDPVFSQLRGLLDGRDARHITESARVRAPHRHIERPIRQALVNEVVLRDDSRRVPQSDSAINPANDSLGRHGEFWQCGSL